ncbi:MAG: BirA family biotin operon repressor/biotin-[acetyl-CoA-carboxylase] ligase [Parasphingorhabdus sp.]
MTVRQYILTALSFGDFVSGDEMARQLGVSRASINQHVNTLKEQGLEIHAVRGKGYRIGKGLSLLDAKIISERSGCEVEVSSVIDSTNAEVRRRLAQSLLISRYLFAENQTRGRGRQGRSWYAAPYQSILASTWLRFDGNAQDISGLSLAVGVALVRGLQDVGYRQCRLKWPNDLLIDGAKLGGILIEVSGELGGGMDVTVGFGLNLLLPDKLAALCEQNVTDLARQGGVLPHRNDLAVTFIQHLEWVFAKFRQSGFAPFMDEWQSLHHYQGKQIAIQQGRGTVVGIAQGVDGRGALRLKASSGSIISITTGEVIS